MVRLLIIDGWAVPAVVSMLGVLGKVIVLSVRSHCWCSSMLGCCIGMLYIYYKSDME